MARKTHVSSTPDKQSATKDTPTNLRFDEAYEKLKTGVSRLRSTTLDNIDDLVPLVEETTKAYKDCAVRLDAVEEMLSKALGKKKTE